MYLRAIREKVDSPCFCAVYYEYYTSSQIMASITHGCKSLICIILVSTIIAL